MDLIEVQFAPSGALVLVRPGTTVLEAGRLAGVEIDTGCTRGQCGTDAVRIEAGTLEPPAGAEQATLERMGLGPEFRLSCSARVSRGPVRVGLGVF